MQDSATATVRPPARRASATRSSTLRPSVLNTGAPAASAATSAAAWASAGAAAPVAQPHGHLSPADVDPRLEQIVRFRVEQRRHLQLADAEDAHDAHRDVGEEPLGLQALGGGAPHGLELVGHSRVGVDARRPAARGDAGRDAGRRDRSGAGRQQRLPTRQGEQLVEVQVAALGDPAHALLDHGERGGVFGEAHAEGTRETRGGEVVMRRAQTATDDEQVGLGGQGVLQGRRETLFVVGDREDAGHLDSPGTEVGAHEGAVGVASAAVEELVAAEHDGGARQRAAHPSALFQRPPLNAVGSRACG